ncbi:RagB/SusD family nutrient uptake outer membrane protein [Parabacteroides sp. An277]|uniref:RagB/SusD family nutrient uptake outer membrane protein n=1 Tax=Parabacteroides sp. An277 TaxID=1965619 RepID=UPI000B3856E7|nr:RagB/SusD family nutrient uptake outer membrane protein [Parabacteroides sp. An277]OUO49268.1 RagB/SusD family nutrient uptake outer membrane protein [Parabacteroides sp. An277]
MKTKYILASCLVSTLAWTGCQEIDTYPEGGTVTSQQKEEVAELNPDRAEAGVNAIFALFSQYMPNSGALGAERHNDFGYPTIMLAMDANGMDVVSDNNGYNWAGSSLDYTDRSYSSNECQMVWNDLYSIIYAANNVIATIDPATEESASKKFLGQALAARAFCYHVLAQLYQFNYVGHETSPCVPLITNENSEEAAQNGIGRATVQEVYDQIKTDLDQAIELLTAAEEAGETNADKRYINAAVAYGLRARMNLTMQNWAEAAQDADQAIASFTGSPVSIETLSLDLCTSKVFSDLSETNWMWGINVDETDDVVSSGIVNWISHMGSMNYGYANFSLGKQINRALYNTISDTDVRKHWWLDENSESPIVSSAEEKEWISYYYGPYTQVKFAPYNGVVGQSTNANDMPLMRIEEMYLIKAEAEAMSGNVGAGNNTLRDFVSTYRDPQYSFNGSSATDIQEEVYRQRRIELWGEGLIWFDIMRLNKPVDRRGAGFPNAPMVFNIPAGSDILLWRIPENEIMSNPMLEESDNNPSAPQPQPVADVVE